MLDIGYDVGLDVPQLQSKESRAMNTYLNQIIAIEKEVKSRFYAELSEINKIVQKNDLFNGFFISYLKKNEEDEELPSEKKNLQHSSEAILRRVEYSISEFFNITAKKDWTNCIAICDVEIDGQILIPAVPVSYLLFLEKQLTDIRTLLSNMPTLDVSEVWTKDANTGQYRSDPTKTHRTKKIQRPITLYDATPEHPAQTQLITEDVLVGWWSTTKHSGALPVPEKEKMIERTEKLLIAVKNARERANMTLVEKIPEVGCSVFGFIFGR